jgi:Secretion system C-terminal sorting domain
MQNKTVFLFGFLSFLITNILSAQNSPQFSMPMWFEDAIGNKDTIIIGYDTTASFEKFNTLLGEKLLQNPFDSVFDVRVTHGDNSFKEGFSKTIIGHCEKYPNVNCFVSEGIKIIINAKYYPIKVSWDIDKLVQNSCHRGSLLSPDTEIFLLENWWDARAYHCAAYKNQIIDDFSYETNIDAGWLRYETKVEGQGIKSLPGYYFVFNAGYECQQLDSEETNIFNHLSKIYPNPVEDEAILESNQNLWAITEPCHLRVYAMDGRLVQEATQETIEGNLTFSTKNLQQGIYLLQVSQTNGRQLTTKFVK